MEDSLFIPRSTICAFTQSDEVLSVMTDLAAHPLLTRTQFESIRGGIDEILNKFPAGGTPDLLILQHDGPIEDLDRVAEVSAATTQLIVVSRDNDIGRYRKLLDRGGADYLFTPISVELMLGAISRTFARAENRRTGTLVTFMGCGGGAGGSTVAQTAAVLLSQLPGKRVMLLDFDIYGGTVALNFDLNPVKGLRELLRDPKSIAAKEIARIVHDRSASLQILCSTPTLEPGFALKADNFIDVLDQARSLADFVVVDMPGSWSLLHNKMLAMSERVSLVATPTLASYQALRNVLELSGKLRTSLPAPDLILNRWSPEREKQIASTVFAEAIGAGQLVKVADAPEAALRAAEAAMSLGELRPRPEGLEDLAAYCSALAGVKAKGTAETKAPLMRRLFGKKGHAG